MNGLSRYFIFFLLPAITVASNLKVEHVIHSINKNFPVILAAKAEVAKAHAELLTARGGFDPLIQSKLLTSTVGRYKNYYSDTEIDMPISNSGNQFFTGYRLGRGNFPVYDQKMWTYNQGELRLGLDIPWWRDRTLDKRRANILMSHYSLTMSEKELELKKIQVLRDGIFSYWDWYLEGNKLLVQQKLLNLAEERQKVIQHRFDTGDIPNLDIIENQRIIMQRKIFLAEQAQNHQKTALLLSLYLRDNQGNPIIPTLNVLPNATKPFPTIKIVKINTTDLARVLANHPVMKQFEQQKNISFIALSLAKNDLKPKLNNRVYLAQDFGPGNPPLNRTSVNVELDFELPINQRQAFGRINAAKSSLEKIAQDEKMFIDRLSVNINNVKNKINMIKQMIALTQKELAMAQELESAEKIKYNHGDSNLLLINLREQSTVETEIRLITTLVEYHKAQQEYLYTIGSISTAQHVTSAPRLRKKQATKKGN